MPTMSQLIRGSRKKDKNRKKLYLLKGQPQRKAVCVAVKIIKPRKPNSACRKVARVRFADGSQTFAYIPGEKHTLQEHNMVLVAGKPVNDLPGVNYRLVRGVYNFAGVVGRRTARSRYAVKKVK
ncbi:30S ribosomal protein S12 [bacterium AB1]|nr:30S ribosomal protein S12 [bacterium AB1]